MQKEKTRKINRQSGAAMLISVIFFLFISLAIVAGLVAPSVREFKISHSSIQSHQSFFLSESVSEDSYFRLKTAKAIGSTNTITLGENSATATITNSDYNEKTISSVGDVASRERKNELVLNTGVGASFSYGVQVGAGGLDMDNNSNINGSVYSNGPITGSGDITGSAFSANSAELAADQTNDSGISSDVMFGKTDSAQDFAQSFKISTTSVINKVELYIKKNGTSDPGNLIVKIVSNSGTNPSSTVLASGSLSASLVSTSYGWVNVPFSSNPELNADTTYWIVIDGSTSSAKYYYIGANDNGYADGTGKIGRQGGTWNNTTPPGLDGFFKLYLGGVTGLISGVSVGLVGVGDAYAHTINSATVAGTKYCESTNNSPACNTTLDDPTPVAMPISDQNILDWKTEAEAGGVYTENGGNYTLDEASGSLGAQKITGDLFVDNHANLTITGTVWVQGKVTIQNGAHISLSSSYGSSEGVIVADGIVKINNNAVFSGSGSAGSYLMVLSTSSSTSAITLENNGGAVILYAANGTVNLSNNAGAKSLNGKYIHLGENSDVIYDSGLANANFVNGPSGGWGVTSWKEVQ